MCEEHHRQRFAAPLGMPEHANFAISSNRILSADNSFFHGKILVICTKNFDYFFRSIVKAHEILNNIQQPCFWQHSIKHGLPRSVLRFGIVPIDRLPCHVTILVRGNGTNSSFSHIAHYAEHIRHKQARNLLHVLTKLQISVRRISFHT